MRCLPSILRKLTSISHSSHKNHEFVAQNTYPREFCKAKLVSKSLICDAGTQALRHLKALPKPFGRFNCDLKCIRKPFEDIKYDLKALRNPFGRFKCDLRVLPRPFGRFNCDLKGIPRLFGHIKCHLKALLKPFGRFKRNFCIVRQSCGGARGFV